MYIEEIYEDLRKNINESIIKKEENMSTHTSFKVGGNADIFIKVKNMKELKYIMQYSKEKDIPLTVIGNGSNILVKDKGIRGITISIDFDKIEIEDENSGNETIQNKIRNNKIDEDELGKNKAGKVLVTVGSGVKLSMLAILLQKKGISGFEFASRYSRNHRRGS